MSLKSHRAILPITLACALLVPAWLFAQRTLIHAGTVIDGVSDSPRTEVTLIIENGKIVTIDGGFTQPLKTDTVYDLRKKFA